MPRNFRSTTTPSLQKTSAKRKQNIADSSDDDYGGVDQISDSDEDEPDVEELEEQAIIESEDEDANDPEMAPDFFEEHLAAIAGASDGDVFQSTSENEVINTRRVRFDLDNESDSNSGEEEDDDFFPDLDIFVPKDELNSSFRREIDRDDGDGILSDDSWEAHDPEDMAEEDIARAIEENEDDEGGDSDDEGEGDSSGYDSDDSGGGYTTDEDIPGGAFTASPAVILHQRSRSSSEEEVVRQSRPGPLRVPKLGTWTVKDKPYMLASSQYKCLMFNRNAVGRRSSVDALSTPARTSRTNSITNGALDKSPMISNSGNIMMGAMSFADIDPLAFSSQLTYGQAIGPLEAFYPFTSINADGTTHQDSSSVYDEDDVDDENLWDLGDFLEFGNEEDEEENAEEPGNESADGDNSMLDSTPARPVDTRSEDQVHPLLDHFNKGVVGSFRRNQNRHQLLTRNAATRDSLAFGGTHLDGTIRGVKSGRLQYANTPITPARKAKSVKKSVDSSSPASPLATLNKKRKYDGQEFTGHKRNKSLI